MLPFNLKPSGKVVFYMFLMQKLFKKKEASCVVGNLRIQIKYIYNRKASAKTKKPL